MIDPVDLASELAGRLRPEGTWDLYAQRLRRYELHLNGSRIDLSRGPLTFDGLGLRVLRPRDGKLGVGFQATSDFTDAGLARARAAAERSASQSEVPAARAVLPSGPSGSLSAEGVCDLALWNDPTASLEAYLEVLLGQVSGVRDVSLSFGSIRATLAETSIANSEGLAARYPSTEVEIEFAFTAHGGPEGAPRGENWVTGDSRRVDTPALADQVGQWCQEARDAQRAVPPPTGDLSVIFPSSVLRDFLPSILGSRFSGTARLFQIAPEIGSAVGHPGLSIFDDGSYPWGPLSSPVDDEGTHQSRRTLLDHGRVSSLLYASIEAAIFDTPPTGNGFRSGAGLRHEWQRCLARPSTSPSTIWIPPGSGGSLEDLADLAGDGVLVKQLGFPLPDPVTTAFGGELRLGYRIRNGKIAEPVRGGTVGGPGVAAPGAPSLLANTIAVGATVELAGTVASPPILVRPFSVASV